MKSESAERAPMGWDGSLFLLALVVVVVVLTEDDDNDCCFCSSPFVVASFPSC